MIFLKKDEVVDFLAWPPIDLLALKCKPQHQFSNIIETTQLTNDQMPEYHC